MAQYDERIKELEKEVKRLGERDTKLTQRLLMLEMIVTDILQIPYSAISGLSGYEVIDHVANTLEGHWLRKGKHLQ